MFYTSFVTTPKAPTQYQLAQLVAVRRNLTRAVQIAETTAVLKVTVLYHVGL